MKGGGKPTDIVRGANIGSDPMYELFRETGVFVGKDAWYCCFDHPDAGLRGVLELKNLITGGRIRRPDAFVMMIQQCVSKSLPLDADLHELQILFSYNVSFDRLDLAKVARRTFEVLGCNKMCFLDESSLTTIGSGFSSGYNSALVVDIGTSSTKVQPVYENLTMRSAALVSRVGGEHCTNYLELLLHAQTSDRFSQQRGQRRAHIARELKRKYAYVCENFEQAIVDFGEFSFEEVNVMAAMGNTIPIRPKKASKTTDLTSSIRAKEAVNLPDGSVIVFTMDIERFYCAEVLFKPSLWEECKDQQSIPELILKSASMIDGLVRQDVCERIILSGKSALIPGLKDRLRAELKSGMEALGVPNFQIIVVEETANANVGDVDSHSAYPSASWKGADYRVKRATDPFVPYNIEPQHFVTFGDYDEQGARMEPNLF
jgi:actin-related protein